MQMLRLLSQNRNLHATTLWHHVFARKRIKPVGGQVEIDDGFTYNLAMEKW